MTRTLLLLALLQLAGGLLVNWLLPHLHLGFVGTLAGVSLSGILLINGACVGIMTLASAFVDGAGGIYGKWTHQKRKCHR